MPRSYENRSAIRLLLADVDGTLVNDEKILTEAARSAVNDLRQAGIAFAISSSRPPRGLRMLIEPLALQLPLAALNGGVIVNPDLSVVDCHRIGLPAARRTVDLLRDHGLDVWLYTESEWLVLDPDGPHVATEAWILQFDPAVVAGFADPQLARAVKIVGVSEDPDLVAECERVARDTLGETASVARSNASLLDVTNPRANKGVVVLTLAKLLGLGTSQIATIGDMPNDVMMFAESGLSIAMGNASDAVQSNADHVTTSDQDDGFAHAVRHFILPQSV